MFLMFLILAAPLTAGGIYLIVNSTKLYFKNSSWSVKGYKIGGCVFLGMAAVLLIYGAIICNQFPTSSNTTSSSIDTDSWFHDEYDAFAAAQSVVKSKLKSPSTAKFCSAREATISRSGDTWTIYGWVEAQNSFGATIRNNFTVKITFTGSNKYTIQSCDIY